MANSLAVATVTECLCDLLRDSAAAAVPGAVVAAGPPGIETGEEAPRIDVWLYSAAADAAVRNGGPEPLDRGGTNSSRATGLPLGLSYLIGFSGPARTLEREILFGEAALALHGSPVLNREMIRRAVATNQRLAGSDLAEDLQPAAIRLADPGEEAIGRLWASLPGVARRLSLYCTIGPVILDPADPLVQPQA